MPGSFRNAAAIARPARAAAGLLLLCAQAAAIAVTPVSPQLVPESRTELLAMLAQAGFPEVGRNSVLIALGGLLGFKPSAQTYEYDEPYPQLPRITARATPRDADCADVALEATYAQPAPARYRVDGTYCVVGFGEWRARQQAVARQ